jgi:hypothetical protein
LDDEKKFKLEDLPDEESGGSVPPAPVIPLKTPEPRILRLKKLDDEAKVTALTKKWIFDKDRWNSGWVIALGFLLFFQKLELDELFLKQMTSSAIESEFFRDTFVTPFMDPLVFILGNPIVLALLIPVFLKFKSPSEYSMELSFDGVNTVKKVQELPPRVFIKWPEITKVKKAKYFRRQILILSSPSGEIGEMIWDIPRDQKRAFKFLIDGWLADDHALKKFLEKDMK